MKAERQKPDRQKPVRHNREHMTELFRERLKALARHDAIAAANAHAEDGVYQSPMAGTVIGRGAIAKMYEAWFKGFPDFALAAEELVVEGDRVIEIGTFSGTDTGGFMGLPATGKQFRLPVVSICTVQDGSIAKVRTIYDFTGLLLQVGILKAKPI